MDEWNTVVTSGDLKIQFMRICLNCTYKFIGPRMKPFSEVDEKCLYKFL